MEASTYGGSTASGPHPGAGVHFGGGAAMGEADETAPLLAALSRGERAAAERLVESSYRQIYAALFRMCGGDAELAADLTQETYRKAWEALPRFEGRAQLSTWLFRIAYNTFLHHVRRPRLMQELSDETEATLADPDPDVATSVVAADEAERLRRAVLKLPEDLRFTISAHFWSELPVSEVAKLEHITPVAIRKRLKRAFAALRLALEEPTS
jgi:RNA polymerase sigma-70 factor (ECF subfamily)